MGAGGCGLYFVGMVYRQALAAFPTIYQAGEQSARVGAQRRAPPGCIFPAPFLYDLNGLIFDSISIHEKEWPMLSAMMIICASSMRVT